MNSIERMVWREVGGMAERQIHDYFGADFRKQVTRQIMDKVEERVEEQLFELVCEEKNG